MTLSGVDLLLYAGALAILFLTPGPVWVALIARTIAGGFHAAWPLALGVVVGDVIWPLIAIFGLTALVDLYAEFITYLRYSGGLFLIWIGAKTIFNANKPIIVDEKLSVSGVWAGFLAGLLIMVGNPKAIIFYIGILPSLFNIEILHTPDILVICAISMAVPFIGNLLFALLIGRIRKIISSPTALRRINIVAGSAIILVGVSIVVL
ncbi:MAG: LysE family translocator [Paracoccaceae bacterium]